MNKKVLFLAASISWSICMYAQTGSSADSSGIREKATSLPDTALLDQELLNDLRALLDSMDFRSSFFSIGVGAGNRFFSLRNNNFNAQQQTTDRIAFTPSASYFHKSGFGFTAMGFLSEIEGKTGFYQYALSPSYDYLRSRKVSFGISYTWYLTEKQAEFYATPFKHEIYAYAQGRKGWMRPGFSAGWATGSYQDIRQLDTVIFGIPRRFIDTTDADLQDFSLMASVSHVFDWDDVIHKGDGISVIPQVMFVAGAQHIESNSKFSVFGGRQFTRLRRTFRFDSEDQTGLRFQSVAFSLSASWFMGKFSVSPGYFISYYIPETDEKVSQIFSVMLGWTF
jgi:hypothetical protein